MSSIDVAGLVGQLMEVERQPLNLLTARQATFKKRADALDSLKSLVTDVGTKASALDIASEWNLLKVSSSSSAVTTAVTSGGFSGSLTFRVDKLATSQRLYSTNTLASTDSKVTSASRLLLAAGGGAIGIGQASGSADLSVGAHTVEVTQSSAAAVRTGPWPSSAVDFDDSSNNLTIMLNGTEYTVTLGNGVASDQQAVLDRLNNAFATAKNTLGTTVDISKDLKATTAGLTTTAEGSASSIQVTGGSALATLGWTADAGAVTGTDGKVKVDGVETVVGDARTGATVVLPSTTGSITATLSGGLRKGTLSTRQVDLGDGSLSAVVNAVNGAGGDVTASAIKVGEGAYRFQVQSKTSGAVGIMNFDPAAVFSGFGGFSVLSEGSDAKIIVDGTTPLEITSSSNTFTDVLPGVNFTVTAKSNDAVTITAISDQDTLTSRIQALVDSVNRAVGDIKSKTTWDVAAKSGGPLTGDMTVSRLQQTLRTAITDTVVGGDLAAANQAGITLNKDGTLAFDKAKFLTAYNANPTAVQRLFVSDTDDPDPGITQRLADVVKKATDYTSGSLSTASKTQRDRVTDITRQLDAWDLRLAKRQDTLTAQFSSLNAALQSLGNQSQWLAGQLAGLG
jgi:flagellar hook-associated protein 2